MKICSLPACVIFSIKLANIMQMQETLTGSTFGHVFSFFAIFNPFSGGSFHVKSTDFWPFFHGPPPILLKFCTLVGIV